MNEMMKQQLGQRLSVLASIRGVSQVRIAKECRISRISVNRFFRGHSELKASDLMRVLQVLGIDIDQEISQRLQTQLISSSPGLSA